jgi:transcriptional regulator with XRE-family HTH domain
MIHQGRAGDSDPFLEELIDARRAKGWTQQKLADELGLSRPYIAMVEIGAKKPSVETARLWAEKLGIDPKKAQGWVHSRRYEEDQDAHTSMAEYRYTQHDPNIQVKVASLDQIGFESNPDSVAESRQRQLPLRPEAKEDVLRVPLIPEGADPEADPKPLEYITVQANLLQGERLLKPFAYRLSPQGVLRVSRTLHPGDYAVISREQRPIEPEEIYAVQVRHRIVLSRIMEKGPGLLLLMSDQGQEGIDIANSEDGKTRSLIVGKVVVAIRPLQYSIVKPSGGSIKTK